MKLDRTIKARQDYDRAILAMTAGRLDEAHHHLRHALATDPQMPEARLAQARLSLARQLPIEALAALDALQQYHPQRGETPEVRFTRAEALVRAGLTDLADKLVRQLAADFPDDVRPHRLESEIARQLGDEDRMIPALRRVVRLDPTDRAARAALAELLAARQPQQAAELLCANGDGDGNRQPGTMLRVARLLRDAGRCHEAQGLFDELLAEHDDDADLWLEAAALSDAVGAVRQARARIGRALQHGGGRSAVAAMAITHMHEGALAPAGRLWWKLARRHRDDIEAWAGLFVCAAALRKLGLMRRARRVLETRCSRTERRIALARLWQHAASGMAVTSAAKGHRREHAIEERPLERLLRQAQRTLHAHADAHPGRADTHYHQAVCAAASGDRTTARQSVRAALSINPNYIAAAKLASRLKQRSATTNTPAAAR